MTEIIAFLAQNGMTIVEGLLSIVGGFSLIATLTPNKTDDRIAQVLLDAINFVGGNVGKAKNAE